MKNLMLCFVSIIALYACKSTSADNGAVVNNYFLKVKENVGQNTDSIKHYLLAMRNVADSFVPEQKCKLLYAMGTLAYSTGHSEKGKDLLTTSLQIAKNINNDSLQAFVLMGICNCYLYSSNIDKAVDALLQARALFMRQSSQKNKEKIFAALALVYYTKADTIEAKKYLELVDATSEKNTRSYVLALHVKANIYTDNGQLDSALLTDRIALGVAQKYRINDMITAVYDNMALCNFTRGNVDSAEFFFNKCLEVDSAGGQTRKMADTYSDMTYMYSKFKQKEKFTHTVNKAIALCDSTGFLRGKYNIYKGLEEYYDSKTNADTLLKIKDSLASIKEQMLSKESDDKINELNVQYETSDKEHTIGLQQVKLQKNKLLLAVFAIVLLLSVLLFYSFYRNAKNKKDIAIARAIQEQKSRNIQAVFESEQNERIRIARDLHDSIGQKLSVAKMFLGADHLEKNKLEDLLDDSITEVRNISHNLIPESLHFGLINAIKSTVQKMEGNKDVAVDFEMDDESHDLKINLLRSLNIFRIFQEIINNTVKHSRANTIKIKIYHEANVLFIVISDNGIGLKQEDIERSTGIGWQNIFSRIDLLKASLEIRPNSPQGTIIQIASPMA